MRGARTKSSVNLGRYTLLYSHPQPRVVVDFGIFLPLYFSGYPKIHSSVCRCQNRFLKPIHLCRNHLAVCYSPFYSLTGMVILCIPLVIFVLLCSLFLLCVCGTFGSEKLTCINVLVKCIGESRYI